MADKTVAELQAEISAAQLELDRIQIAPIRAVIDAFNKPTIAAAIQTAEANIEQLTGERRTQVQNLITVLRLSPSFLAEEVVAIEARLDPQAEAEPET